MNISGAPSINAAGGISVPGALAMGDRQPKVTQYIFIQNDTYTDPSSIWSVQKLSNTQYAMPNATAPRGSIYIGVFLRDIDGDTSHGRLDSTVEWTVSDPSIATYKTPSASGQTIFGLLRAGKVLITCRWNGLVSVLTITAT